IDDIEDGSYLRCGKPAAHYVFGAASSINSANYVYFLALGKLSVLKRPESVTIFTETGGLFSLGVRLMQLFSENQTLFV
ncbi:hypothetical protein MN116_008932, partial [Schistosoma mekongi]